MELRQLIQQIHQLKLQRQQVLQQEKQLKQQLDVLDAELRKRLDDTGVEYAQLSEDEFQLLLSEMGDNSRIAVEVVYATPEHQAISALQVPAGSTIEDAIVLCRIAEENPEIDLSVNKVGVYGTVKTLTDTLQDGDRVEIYRPVAV